MGTDDGRLTWQHNRTRTAGAMSRPIWRDVSSRSSSSVRHHSPSIVSYRNPNFGMWPAQGDESAPAPVPAARGYGALQAAGPC
jgi:hypothetical protein